MAELRSQLGELLVCGFDGVVLPQHWRELLERQMLGGLILFARNYENSEKLKRLTEEARIASAGRCFIAVDQEGGRVARFSGDFPVFPSPGFYGKSEDIEGLLQATKVTATALREHGVNLNLAPVCDLDPNDSKHVLNTRAYASDPTIVAAAVAAQIAMQKSCGVMSCAKHFPGLGSSTGDPHFQVAESAQTLEQFRQLDYVPFEAAIRAGADMVMPTHLRAKALDQENVVTFSSKAIEGELRAHLQFAGLVISDDLQMLGALEGIDQVEAGRRALLAGNELLIYANLHDTYAAVLDGLVAHAEKDGALRARIEASYQRLIAFRHNNPEYFPA
ncbi:MAG: glycoside hydrolase family 3 N-terminal domain-containing protein [Candidatus Zixiibacteriota bacterium]